MSQKNVTIRDGLRFGLGFCLASALVSVAAQLIQNWALPLVLSYIYN